ncbi:MAG: hypothetical protein KIS30_05925 [Thermoplasmata archaeon]|nr:hypothetical protein [Candidatus Sysuiplasma acidicola]MBX8646277.1 hypothetical protein [Candidatus Sysuiplasma acidicola]
MAKLIAISEDVYNRLSKLKEREKAKSFTAVISELLKDKETDISDLFGAWKMDDKGATELKERIRKERRRSFSRSDL